MINKELVEDVINSGNFTDSKSIEDVIDIMLKESSLSDVEKLFAMFCMGRQLEYNTLYLLMMNKVFPKYLNQ
jgi:hypothetical protein